MESSLREGEPHPIARNAQLWVAKYVAMNPMVIESIASCALSNNRTAEICHSTLTRLLNGEPVSDRYLLGLAWFLKELDKEI